MFLLGIGSLMLNRFYHFIFSYNEAHEYIPEKGSLATFIFVLAFYAILSMHMLIAAYKTKGSQKIRYMAVAYTSMALGIFMFLQILTSFLPLYVSRILLTMRCAGFLAPFHRLVTAVVTGNITASTANTFIKIDMGIDNITAV